MNSKVKQKKHIKTQRKVTENEMENEINTVQIEQKQMEVDIKQIIEKVIEQ